MGWLSRSSASGERAQGQRRTVYGVHSIQQSLEGSDYPLVDAGMRQLVQTGWMHKRARMVTTSFLTKNLLIDWRWGAAWFMNNLVDCDPAANSGGWRSSAGSGPDAAPYIRIFNPQSQSLKHDPQRRYVRRWLPELAGVPDAFVHNRGPCLPRSRGPAV